MMTGEPQFTAAQFAKAGLTLDQWFAYRVMFGHVCCNCSRQTPPMSCCNAGHVEAVARAVEFERIVGTAR